jgi:hypothetical protein
MIAVEPLAFRQGDEFVVRFQTSEFADWSLFVVPSGGDYTKQTVLSAKGPTVISTRPTMRFGSVFLNPGSYDAVLLNANTKQTTSSAFEVLEKNAAPQVRSDKSIYKTGEPLQVSWKNAPGMKNDWVGIYRKDDPDLFTGYIRFVYTGATVKGSALLKAPDQPGQYELRLMREDAYVMLATAPFRVE